MELTRQPPPAPPSPFPGRTSVAHERPAITDYLDLYAAVGTPVNWDQRLRMPRTALQALLDDDSTRLFVLRLDATAVGMCEFVSVLDAEVELTNFGLVPAAQGKGLGPFLLRTALNYVWSASTRRIRLRTDTADSPHAIPTYEKAGFRIVSRGMESFPD